MGFRFPDPGSTWTLADAQTIFDEWRRCGGTLAAFARRHGVTVARLYWWKRRVVAVPVATTAALSLVPATITSESATITIRVPGEIAIEVSDVSPSWVATIVAELARSRS